MSPACSPEHLRARPLGLWSFLASFWSCWSLWLALASWCSLSFWSCRSIRWSVSWGICRSRVSSRSVSRSFRGSRVSGISLGCRSVGAVYVLLGVLTSCFFSIEELGGELKTTFHAVALPAVLATFLEKLYVFRHCVDKIT